MEQYPKVSVVILNWNGWHDTIECLESLYLNTYPNYDVIVVDNNSADNSLEKIREYCNGDIEVASPFFKYSNRNKPIEVEEHFNLDFAIATFDWDKTSKNERMYVIKNEKNYGFPEGNNIGIKFALNKGADFVLLLNNDVVVEKNFLSEAIRIARKDPKNGMIGSKVCNYHAPETIQSAGGTIKWISGSIKNCNASEVHGSSKYYERDFVWATSVLISRDVFAKIGLLDPYFFFGIEEYDFCTRAKKAGFNVLYLTTSVIWHKGGASSSKLSDYPETLKLISKQRGFINYKHYHKLFKKHIPGAIYIVPYSIFMFRMSTGLTLLLIKYIFTLNFKKIKKGYKMLR